MYHPIADHVKGVEEIGQVSDLSDKTRRVTIQDVARAAGVSAATVSRALKADTQISSRTRDRVVQLAGQLGYVPNEAARSLVLQHTSIVALIIPDMADPVYGQIATGFEQVISDYDHEVILSSSGNMVDREWAAIEAVVAHRAAGIALLGSILRQDDVLNRVGATPCVFIESENIAYAGYAEDAALGSIRSDDKAGMDQVADHLSERGYRRIAYASGPDVASNLTRRDALERAAKARDIEVAMIDAGPDDWREPTHLVRALLRTRPEAVVCYDDKLALGLMNELRASGVSVPSELAIVGFDDIPFASLMHPRLTTVAQPSLELGREAAQMLIASLNGSGPPESRVLPVDLVVRESTPGLR